MSRNKNMSQFQPNFQLPTKTTRLIFPGDAMNDEIPVFLTFYFAPYSRFNSGRTKDAIVKENYISVPYPKLFNISNDMKYENAGTIGTQNALELMKMKADEMSKSLNFAASYFFNGGNAFTFDNMETVLSPGGRRKYVVSMDLIAKSNKQAEIIKDIVDAFQTNMHSSWDGGNKLIWKHPPLWVIKTTSGTRDKEGWDPSTLPSVLVHMDVNRNPVLDIPFDLNGYPLAVNINLTFLELEPAVNNKGTLSNRAETFTT
jgi:hypothetical protein